MPDGHGFDGVGARAGERRAVPARSRHAGAGPRRAPLFLGPFDHPGPRLRDYIEAVKACFAGFRGAGLDHHGEFYDLSLLPQTWSPGPIDVADPPVDLAAVNPWMLRMTATVADGVHVHPLNSPTYHAETLLPNLAAGRGRPLGGFTAFVPVFTAAGDTGRGAGALARDDPHHGRVLRIDAELRVRVRADRPPGTTEALRAAQKSGEPRG